MDLQEVLEFLQQQSAGEKKQKIFLLVLGMVLLIAAAFFFLQFTGKKTVTVEITDRQSGQPLDAKITIATFSQVLAVGESKNGSAVFAGIDAREKVRVIVEKKGYKSVGVELEPSQTNVEASLEREILRTSMETMAIVTSSKNLERKYGAETAKEIISKATELAQTINETEPIGASLYVIDSKESSEGHGFALAENPDDARQVLASIYSIVQKTRPAYLLIVGGPRIIPFQKIENPLAMDENRVSFDFVIKASPTIETDNLYGMFETPSPIERTFFPDVAVARIPDGIEINMEGDKLLVEIMQNAIDKHRQKARQQASFSTFTSDDSILDYYGKFLFTKTGPNDVLKSPEFFNYIPETMQVNENATREINTLVDNSSIMIVLLHGNEPFAEQALAGIGFNDQRQYMAYSPAEMQETDFYGKTILIDSCWGASLERPANAALPIIALRKGANAFMGSTETALSISRKSYKSIGKESDLSYLGVSNSLIYLMSKKLSEGETIGKAFLEAKKSLSWGSEPEYLTNAEFVLYGDPTLKIG
ncbi:TPA: hypothetical protein HA244_06585 [Candidatus Micrarchaeota archaeon]|nr:hypothetical protein [Candidatus Micrarchaeota archaeon]